MKLFSRKPQAVQSSSAPVDPQEMPEPQNSAEYLRRGYAYYSRGRFREALADFQRSAALDPDSVDAVYGLGMAQKASKLHDESVKTFQQVLTLLNAGAVADRVRADMLRRLALGHINEITSGNWNLEKEIWHHVE